MPDPSPLGDILKNVARKTSNAKRALKGRRLAQKIIDETLGPKAEHVSVAHVKRGVVTLETDSPAFFQELKGFHREQLIAALRDGGMIISTLRARLTEN